MKCPVRVCDSLRVNLTVMESINLQNKLPGGRSTEFSGTVPYAYGRVKFSLSPHLMPDTPVFNDIIDTLGSKGLK